MRKGWGISVALSGILLFSCTFAYPAIIYLKQFTFNDDRPLAKWSKMILNGQVDYSLQKDGSEGFVRALSNSACSALYYRIGYNLKNYPLLSWQWRVSKFPDLSKAKTDEDRDDYAARMYVIFPFLSYSSSKFLEYVWSESLPVGTMMTSPFGDNVKMIVARTGPAPANDWVRETRNVYEDYVKAFGKPPGLGVGAIAIMSDSEGSRSTAESFFDDIAIETTVESERRMARK